MGLSSPLWSSLVGASPVRAMLIKVFIHEADEGLHLLGDLLQRRRGQVLPGGRHGQVEDFLISPASRGGFFRSKPVDPEIIPLHGVFTTRPYLATSISRPPGGKRKGPYAFVKPNSLRAPRKSSKGVIGVHQDLGTVKPLIRPPGLSSPLVGEPGRPLRKHLSFQPADRSLKKGEGYLFVVNGFEETRCNPRFSFSRFSFSFAPVIVRPATLRRLPFLHRQGKKV